MADNPRSFPVNPAAVRMYKAIKGWNDETLAEEAGLSIRTIERIWKGIAPLSMQSIDRLARAFGVTCDKLLLFEPGKIVLPPFGPPVKVADRPDSRVAVKIAVTISVEEFKQTDRVLAFLSVLRKIIGGTGQIEIDVQEGGGVATLTMSKADALRMLAEMIDGGLKNIGVTSVEVPDEKWLVRMIVTLKIMKTPAEPDEEAWSELLNARAVEEVIARWVYQ